MSVKHLLPLRKDVASLSPAQRKTELDKKRAAWALLVSPSSPFLRRPVEWYQGDEAAAALVRIFVKRVAQTGGGGWGCFSQPVVTETVMRESSSIIANADIAMNRFAHLYRMWRNEDGVLMRSFADNNSQYRASSAFECTLIYDDNCLTPISNANYAAIQNVRVTLETLNGADLTTVFQQTECTMRRLYSAITMYLQDFSVVAHTSGEMNFKKDVIIPLYEVYLQFVDRVQQENYNRNITDISREIQASRESRRGTVYGTETGHFTSNMRGDLDRWKGFKATPYPAY